MAQVCSSSETRESCTRLKVPPSINQFTQTLDQQTATQLFKLLHKYRPETKAEKKGRLTQLAERKAAGKADTEKKPVVIKYGINHITKLIESKKAKLVCIAHDVDPIEIVVWLPALCRKMGVPYCIVKGKARLGKLVHKKTATAIAVTNVKQEDKDKLEKLSVLCEPTTMNVWRRSNETGEEVSWVARVKQRLLVSRRPKLSNISLAYQRIKFLRSS